MFHQYKSQRRCGGDNPHGEGVLDLGTILYIQDGIRPMSGLPRQIVCREPWQVVAFLPEQHPFYGPMARTGLVLVKSLRTGRTQTVAPWIVEMCEDAGLQWFYKGYVRRVKALESRRVAA